MTFRFHGLAAAALAVAAFLSCSRQELGKETMQEMTRLSVSSHKPAYDGGQTSTKTQWNESTVLWSAGDRISVCLTEDGLRHDGIYESEALTEDSSRATFDFAVPSTLTGTLRFYTVFPSSAAAGFADGLKLNVTLPSVQTPSASSFDPEADLMSGTSVKVYDGIPQDDVSVIWDRLVAHADITLSGLAFEASETVKSVKFKVQDGAALAGDFLLDLQTSAVTSSANVTDEITVNADNLQLSADGSLRVWLSFMPLTVTSLEMSVTTDKAVYVRNIPSCSVDFRRNARNYLTVDMSSALKEVLPEYEDVLDASVNARLFDVLDLDSPQLADVAALYADGHLYRAAEALLGYWRTGRSVVNPNVDLTQTTYSSADKEKADKALKENGYCFYVNNYDFHSFADGNGGIDWGFALQGETQFALQKHRHQWVLPQAKVYWGTKDEKYVQSYMDVYSSWLSEHPCPVLTSGSYVIASSHPLRDMWTDLQATSRVMDQINVLDYYVSSQSMTPEFLSHFLVAFAYEVECIRANPYYEPLSNHRLYEIQAVFTAAVMMPEFRNASAWLDEAAQDLAEQVTVQFAEDGVLVEMDPGYHIPMVAIFYDTHKIAAANGKSSVFPSDFTEYLQKAVKFVRDLAYPDYGLEDFNDVRSSSWNKSTLTKNFVKYHEMFPDDQTLLYWASGHADGAAPDEKLSLYTTTGWYMLRNGWTKGSSMMILKNNYNKRDNGSVWWHCQPDNGTVSLYHDGRRFLPDAGAYTYTDGTDRDAFRATAMHNTLTKNLATISDSNMLGEYVASGEKDRYSYIHVRNQSYGNLRHERVVFMVDDKYFVVVDSALGSFTNTSVEVSWHLCPGTVLYDDYGSNAYGCHTSFADGNNMLFKTFCFSGDRGIVPYEDFIPSSGESYTSSEINVRMARKYYRTAVKVGSSYYPVRFITVIYPVSDYGSAPSVSASFDSELSKILVSIGDESVELRY